MSATVKIAELFQCNVTKPNTRVELTTPIVRLTQATGYRCALHNYFCWIMQSQYIKTSNSPISYRIYIYKHACVCVHARECVRACVFVHSNPSLFAICLSRILPWRTWLRHVLPTNPFTFPSAPLVFTYCLLYHLGSNEPTFSSTYYIFFLLYLLTASILPF